MADVIAVLVPMDRQFSVDSM